MTEILTYVSFFYAQEKKALVSTNTKIYRTFYFTHTRVSQHSHKTSLIVKHSEKLINLRTSQLLSWLV